MSSKLFRAVVGLGISLGTASAACFGAVDSGSNGTEPPANSAPSAPDKKGDPADVGAPQADATVDSGSDSAVATTDAAADAPSDAMLDAFCDAAWPTTKGNPSGPTCGAVADCKDAGPAPYCFTQVDATSQTCDSTSTKALPAWCVSGHWECSGGGVPQQQCKCWTGEPCP